MKLINLEKAIEYAKEKDYIKTSNQERALREVFALATVEAVPILEEPCSDAISRKAVKAYKYNRTMYPNFEDYVDMLPPVNPQPKTGHWIKHETYTSCSECGKVFPYCKIDYAFCPKCGARMVEP